MIILFGYDTQQATSQPIDLMVDQVYRLIWEEDEITLLSGRTAHELNIW